MRCSGLEVPALALNPAGGIHYQIVAALVKHLPQRADSVPAPRLRLESKKLIVCTSPATNRPPQQVGAWLPVLPWVAVVDVEHTVWPRNHTHGKDS